MKTKQPKPMTKLRRYIVEHRPRITQTQLADASGTTHGSINQILLGYRPMPERVVRKLLSFGIPAHLMPKIKTKKGGTK